jgi:hypothetical protein
VSAAESEEHVEGEAGPVGEEIHMPGPSILPILLAAGIALALIGITISIILVILGLAIAIPVIVVWIRSTISDIGELPPTHHH